MPRSVIAHGDHDITMSQGLGVDLWRWQGREKEWEHDSKETSMADSDEDFPLVVMLY